MKLRGWTRRGRKKHGKKIWGNLSGKVKRMRKRVE